MLEMLLDQIIQNFFFMFTICDGVFFDLISVLKVLFCTGNHHFSLIRLLESQYILCVFVAHARMISTCIRSSNNCLGKINDNVHTSIVFTPLSVFPCTDEEVSLCPGVWVLRTGNYHYRHWRLPSQWKVALFRHFPW